jgi:hypothetical protein
MGLGLALRARLRSGADAGPGTGPVVTQGLGSQGWGLTAQRVIGFSILA